MNPSSLLPRVLTLCVASVLIASGAAHAANPYLFLQSIHAYQMAPEFLAPWLAGCLPQLQLVIAACLVAGTFERPALILSAIMFTVFSVVQGSAVYRGLKISCGCFGYSIETVSVWSVGLTAALAVTSIVAAFLSRRAASPAIGLPMDQIATA